MELSIFAILRLTVLTAYNTWILGIIHALRVVKVLRSTVEEVDQVSCYRKLLTKTLVSVTSFDVPYTVFDRRDVKRVLYQNRCVSNLDRRTLAWSILDASVG